jgi:hypothetical protein
MRVRASRGLAAFAAIGGLLTLGSASEAFEGAAASAPSASVTITGAPMGGVPPVQPGFLGLSVEFPAVASYTGSDPGQPDAVFEQLVRNLSPSAAPVLRIGGDSTDSTWWPVPGAARPPGVSYSLTPAWLTSTATLVRDLRARVIIGVNLEAYRPRLAIAQARALLSAIGPSRISGIEIGNEPSNYPQFPWYRAAGRAVYARPSTYSFTDFTREFSTIRRGLPGVPLAGPALSGYGWLGHLSAFLRAEPTVTTATFHRYPLNRCFAGPGSPMQATLGNLLGPYAARGFLAPAAPSVALAHAHRARFRLDEFNSVSCAGKLGLSDRFASALWAVDALFEVARYGIDGVSIHTFPGVPYAPFDVSHTAGRWSAVVHPEYYGLLMFARAAPAGARLLAVSGPTGDGVRVWATRTSSGTVHVVVINKRVSAPAATTIRLPGARTAAVLERLTAPGVLAPSGVTLGGRQFASHTQTGTLPGPAVTEHVRPRAGRYLVTLPPASAAMLTLNAFR